MSERIETSMGYLSGEVTEQTSYVPVPKQRYRAKIALAEFVDPAAMGWEPDEDLSDEEKAEFFRPFPLVRWQIESEENGGYTEYAGRMVDQRVSLRSGINPKTGRSYAEHRADLIRLKHGLGPKDEVVGYRLFDDGDLAEMERTEAIRVANERMKAYEGLSAVIRIMHIKSKKGDGDIRDGVAKIVLGS